MRILVILLSALLLLTGCKSENKRKETTTSSTNAAMQQATTQPLALAANSMEISSTDTDGPVQDQMLDQQAIQSTEQQQLDSGQVDMDSAADNTSQTQPINDDDAMSDVNPYSLQQLQQPSPPTPSQPANAPADQSMSNIPNEVAPPESLNMQQPEKESAYTRTSHDNDFDFDDMPVPVSIGGRPVGVSTVEPSSLTSANNQRLQGLIDRYDAAKQASTAAQKADESDE